MIKIGDATKGDLGNGNWPGDLGDKQKRYDGLYTGINAPDTPDPSITFETERGQPVPARQPVALGMPS